jgi:DinB family protein
MIPAINRAAAYSPGSWEEEQMTAIDQATAKYDQLVNLVRLARGLEASGLYNAGKVCWALVNASLVRASNERGVPIDTAALDHELSTMVTALAAAGVKPAVIAALHNGRKAVREQRPIAATEIPPIYVCRNCGEIVIGDWPERCPVCDADGLTLREFPAIYYLEQMQPDTALAALMAGPKLVAEIIVGLSEEQLNAAPKAGEWNMREGIQHLLVAQSLFAGRIEKMLAEDDPLLRGVAAWNLMPGEVTGALEIFEQYNASREMTIGRLHGLAAQDWWRTAQHDEFGQVTILGQASYFAKHERSHLVQLRAIRKALSK